MISNFYNIDQKLSSLNFCLANGPILYPGETPEN